VRTLVRLLILACLVVLLAANKACREDYFFATQARVLDPTGTPTASPTPTDEGDDDDDFDLTATATATATVAAERTSDTDPTPEASKVSEGLFPLSAPLSALQEISYSQLSEQENAMPTPTVAPSRARSTGSLGYTGGNWLGNLGGGEQDDYSDGDSRARSSVLVVSENDAFYRSVSAALKGMVPSVQFASDEIELEDSFGSSNSGERIGLVLLDGGSEELPPCDVATEVRRQVRSEGRDEREVVIVVIEDRSSDQRAGRALSCDGQAAGEILTRPLNRSALSQVVAQAAGRNPGR
jgi:CheY-like chemotaxis protein